jgi:hypothetical protein
LFSTALLILRILCSIADFQGVQFQYASMYSDILAAKLMVYKYAMALLRVVVVLLAFVDLRFWPRM